MFGDTGVEISCEGKHYLGGALGTDEYGEKFLAAKVEEWIQEIRTLASFAKTQPHAAHAAFTHGLIGSWTYALRVSTLSSDELLRPLEDVISRTLVPTLTGQSAPCSNLRDLLALPIRQGGKGLVSLSALREQQQQASRAMCKPLVTMITKQCSDVLQAQQAQTTIKKQL